MEERRTRVGTPSLAIKVSIALMILCLWGTACTPAGELVVPREVIVDGGVFSVADMAVTVQQDGEEQVMELLKNRFLFTVNTVEAIPVVSMKIELQNSGANSGNNTNSIYFRAQALPADGKYYSLSGNPADPMQENAAKIIFYEAGSLVSVVPKETSGTADNFRVSVYHSGNRTLQGLFVCTVTLPPTSRTVVVSGSFTTSY